MGFGLLLCGYFILMLTSLGMGEYTFVAYLIGGVITANAASRLKDYCPRFLFTLGFAVAYCAIGLYQGFLWLDDLFLWDLPVRSVWLTDLVETLRFLAEVGLHASMFLGIYELATSLGLQKIRARTLRNAIFVGIWTAGQIVLLLFPSLYSFEDGAIAQILLLFSLACYVLDAILLFSCYQYICDEADVNGRERKPSRIKFVNDVRRKLDERTERALREREEYERRKREERARGQANRPHKKRR